MAVIVLKRTTGDSLPSYDITVQNTDITGFTIIMNFQKPDGTTTFSRTATIIDGPNGLARFTFLTSNFDADGNYAAEIEITDTSGDNETFGPIVVKVRPAIL